MEYSIHIGSKTKRTLNAMISGNESKGHVKHLVATRDSSFYIVAENKTHHKCTVQIMCGTQGDLTHIGVWTLHPMTKLKIEETKEHKFSFTTTGRLNSTDSSELVCELYNITAVFSCLKTSVCTSINVPVHICEHLVNV